MQQLFNILENVDSTNNYAMQKIHEGMAKHGMCWFALNQFNGKGQRSKIWVSNPGENVILSTVIVPSTKFKIHEFYFNAIVATSVRNVLQSICSPKVEIKWPNDIYINDKKAGGILIENKINSTQWRWSVVGTGININQQEFGENNNATSVFNETNQKNDPIEIAKRIRSEIIDNLNNYNEAFNSTILEEYNSHLFNKNEIVKCSINNNDEQIKILFVDGEGNLHVEGFERDYLKFGEVIFYPRGN